MTDYSLQQALVTGDHKSPFGDDEQIEKDLLDAKIKAEQEKYHRMPPRYVAFTIKHKVFWKWLNVFNFVSSGAMAYGTVKILNVEHDSSKFIEIQCTGMAAACWALFTLHLCNMIFSLMAFCGLEKRICVSYVMLALLIYDVIVMIWAHCTYFQA